MRSLLLVATLALLTGCELLANDNTDYSQWGTSANQPSILERQRQFEGSFGGRPAAPVQQVCQVDAWGGGMYHSTCTPTR